MLRRTSFSLAKPAKLKGPSRLAKIKRNDKAISKRQSGGTKEAKPWSIRGAVTVHDDDEPQSKQRKDGAKRMVHGRAVGEKRIALPAKKIDSSTGAGLVYANARREFAVPEAEPPAEAEAPPMAYGQERSVAVGSNAASELPAEAEGLGLDEFETKASVEEVLTPQYEAMKYKNHRRDDRMKKWLAQNPEEPGIMPQAWWGYGMRDTNPHPLHDLSHEELAEYVSGTEYAELPEVKGLNQDYPRAPHNTEAIAQYTTGMEEGSPMLEEDWGEMPIEEPAKVFGSGGEAWLHEGEEKVKEKREKKPLYAAAASSPYDIDLTKPGAMEAYQEDQAEEQELQHEMAYTQIKNAPQYRAVSQMVWKDGKWVASRDPNVQRMVHPAFATDVQGVALATETVDPELDVGKHGDGGYAEELQRFAAMTQSSAGMEADADQDPQADPNLISALEGDPLPGERVAPEPQRALSDGGDDAAAADVLTPQPYISAEAEEVEPLSYGGNRESWEKADFVGLMSVPGEAVDDPAAAAAAAAAAEGLKNGVPVNALDTRQVVDPEAVTTEHEHHVFSGLYPRLEGTPMTPFEKQRLARCLEMHQKKGVPLAYKGVNPYATNAFVRRRWTKTHAYRADDDLGRKHDLAVEFRLRQKLKLKYDVDQRLKPMYRLNNREVAKGSVYYYYQGRGVLSDLGTKTMQVYRANRDDLCFHKTYMKDGALSGAQDGWKHYGATKWTSQMNEAWQAGMYGRVNAPHADMTAVSTYMSKKAFLAWNEGERLRRETLHNEWQEKKRAEKERAYRLRMGLDAPTEAEARQQAAAAAAEKKVEAMRMDRPAPDVLEMSYLEATDEDSKYQVPGDLKAKEDMRATYGRNPWLPSVRYAVWARMVGKHHKAIKEEDLQLRGTGFYNYKYQGDTHTDVRDTHFRMKRGVFDELKWTGGAGPEHVNEGMWDAYNRPVSSDNFLTAERHFAPDELPTSGPSRAISNDLMKYEDDMPEFAFKPVFAQKATVPADTQEVFDWGEARPSTPAPGALKRQARAFSTAALPRRGALRSQRRHRFHLESEEAPIPDADSLKTRSNHCLVAAPAWPFRGTAGVVMTVDGVVQAGGGVLPGAIESVKALKAAGIPTVFYSGGYSEWAEAEFAQNLSQALNCEVTADEVVLAAGSIASHATGVNLKDASLLVIGPRGTVTRMSKLGFKNALSVEGLAKAFPSHLPRSAAAAGSEGSGKATYVVDGILIAGVPDDWASSMQACLDVLTSQDAVGTVEHLRELQNARQGCPVYTLDGRLVHATEHEVPRMSTGMFTASLEALYSKVNAGRSLSVNELGRRNDATQKYLEGRLADVAYLMGHTEPMTHIYNVTDNIDYDAVAACSFRDNYPSSGGRWWSVLLGSGVCKDGNTTAGIRTKFDLNRLQKLDDLGYVDRELLRHHLNDRAVDKLYHSLPMFVADLLKTEYQTPPTPGAASA
eukprot:TRINITY_DN3884_c1_g1_i1.p1 TRINITY_DN3884_c1_g1~~TRINITY_DN3884_c1_g1_i1.p1  ORF type:complete len:1454 (+),score=505.45 TRINITY_DN3884_c1_g1_i1:20-4381(+)